MGEQSSASGMALYSDFRYAIHSEFVLGYLAMFVACLALISASSSYSSCLLRPDDLSKDIGLLCFRACLSILPVHRKGGGPGGARVVTSYAGMVLGYAGSFGYDGAPWSDWGRRQVVTVLPVQQAFGGCCEVLDVRVLCRSLCKDVTLLVGPSSGHSPQYP